MRRHQQALIRHAPQKTTLHCKNHTGKYLYSTRRQISDAIVLNLVPPKWPANQSRMGGSDASVDPQLDARRALEVTLKRIAGLGYESIEISGEPTQYDPREVRPLLDKYKIRCWGAVTLTLAERNLAARDEKQRAASVQYVKDVLTMVGELGGEILTLVPVTVGKIIPDGTPEEEWRWLIDGVGECHEFARKKGIRIGIEPLNRFETYLLNRADQALALAEAVGPECGVCLDAFHLNIEDADMHASIRKAGKRLVDFHIADNNRMARARARSTGRRSSRP